MMRILFATAATMLGLGLAAADAEPTGQLTLGTSYTYETSTNSPQATGTVQYGNGATSGGGLCLAGNPGCAAASLDGPLVSGTGSSTSTGQIGFTTGANLPVGQYWLVTITIDANPSNSRTGDIWEATLINSTTPNGTALGVTDVIASSTSGSCVASSVGGTCTNTSRTSAGSSGSFTITAAADVTETLEITDLLEQYISSTDNPLPGLIVGDGTLDPLDGGTVGSPYDYTTLEVDVSEVATPEPASLAILGGAVGMLGFAGRRRRASHANRATTQA
jgi:hypothetical protein